MKQTFGKLQVGMLVGLSTLVLTAALIILFFNCARHPVGVAVGRKGMVVSAHPLATEVGLGVLKQGGNAVDAAVAVSFALVVVLPRAGNIGGGGFMVIRMADGRETAIDYREKAPLAAFRDMYLDSLGNVIPDLSLYGHLAAGVPGTVAGLALAQEKYGTMEWKGLVLPAISLAEVGFILEDWQTEGWEWAIDDFKRYPQTAAIYLKGDSTHQAGDRFVQPDLARTLKRIAEQGPDEFYQGETARLIVAEMKRGGGIISEQDLADYRAVERNVIQGDYRGYGILSMPPPSSGGVCLIELLNILEGYNLKSLDFYSVGAVHRIAEAEKRVYADRAAFLGDPDFVPNMPIEGLTSKAYADTLRKAIDLNRATPSKEVYAGRLPGPEGKATTHFSVVDRWGNAVAVTTTLNSSFGSLVVVTGAGFLLNNEMDDFSIKAGVPNQFGLLGGSANAIEPGKRMLSSMTPTIVVKDEKPFLILGSPGGARIITTVTQVIINVIDYGMDLNDAIHAPRFHHQWLPDELCFEPMELLPEFLEGLLEKGHRIRIWWYMGRVNGIQIEDKGQTYYGVTDPRGNGKADGY